MKLKANTGLRVCKYLVGTSSSIVLLGFMFNSITGAYAASNPAAVVDNLSVTVDTNCGITHSGSGTYTKTINPGASSTVTANTITAACNDSGGYAIYAAGYSGDSFEGNNTDLISNDNANWNIKTDGSYQGSFWKMKFSASGDVTITSPYTSYQQIPATYAKIASYGQYATSGVITPTYQISLGAGQPAGTYVGKVQYVLVNPSDASAPVTVVPVMQNLSSSSCTTTASQVRDTRDDHIYTIQRLLDGKCWMMENLDLGRTTLTTNLTSSNTNLSTTVTAATFNGWKKTTGVSDFDDGAFISLTASNTSNGLEADPTSGTPYGTLYNYYAASAGTISSDENSKNATYDICPAGWKLPSTGSTGDFQDLYAQYNSNALMRASIANGGAAFALAGGFDTGAPVNQGVAGDYWASVKCSDTGMRVMEVGQASVYPSICTTRTTGRAIRCILK